MTRISGSDEIGRRYLHQDVADRLRELILSGELAPLSRVNELALAERFGISRTPMREAIKILSAEGLLELLPNRGARIASPSFSEIDEMIEVLAALEGSAAELACRHISDRGIIRLAKLEKKMIAAWKASDWPSYFAASRDIHDSVMEASGNRMLQSLYKSLAGRVQQARYSVHKTPEQWARAIAEHSLMTELLRKRAGEELATLMRSHVRSQKSVIAAAMNEPSLEASGVGPTLIPNDDPVLNHGISVPEGNRQHFP